MASESKPKVLDLFAGAGGLSLGFHDAGYNVVAALDHNPIATETLEANFGFRGQASLLRDLATFFPVELERYLKQQNIASDFEIIVGGPPCQGWSMVGRGKLRSLRQHRSNHSGHDPRNHLFENYLSYIDHFRPKVFLMENVPGLLSHNGVNVAESVSLKMENLGYTVSWQVLDSSKFGIPQIRHRVFFVGFRSDLKHRFIFPPWQSKSGKTLYSPVTVRDAIGDLPRIKNGSKDWILAYELSRKTSEYVKQMREGAVEDSIFDHVCRTHNKQDLEAFRFLKQGGWYRDLPKRLKRYRDDIFEDKYKKLFWDKPSWCLTAHLSRDCYTHIHPSQPRTISVREAARLQSFPDCFYFAGGMGSKLHLIGNAVPPLLAKIIAGEIKRQLAQVTRKSTVRTKERLHPRRTA